MTRHTSTRPTGQPSLDDLMVRFLATRSDAATAAAVEPAGGEVEPYEVAAGFRVDPRVAWNDALATLKSTQGSPGVPTEWVALVSQPAAGFAVSMSAGNFPQRVKDLQPLLADFDADHLRPTGAEPPSAGLSGLRTWIIKEAKKRQPAAALLAAGVARAIGETQWAEELLLDAEGLCQGEFRTIWENEWAALLWHRGRSTEALAAWEQMTETPTTLFNRGMAKLFLGRKNEARADLARAVTLLPESNGWNALARLYLAVSEIAN